MTTAKYQLVLQLPVSSIKDYDAMIELEETIMRTLGNLGNVDGHDLGSGETNIFILTDHPILAFNKIKAIVGTRDFWVHARVAYRELAGSEYTILWPRGLTEFKVA